MIFMGQGSIGKWEYEFWKGIIGYEVIADEGKCFRTTWKNVRELLNQDIPVILFGLDIFHLPYQSKFYHKQHIPGHVVLMIGYDKANVLPELPYEISDRKSGIFNSHKASRDKLAQVLLKYKDSFGTGAWKEAAQHFQKSGKMMEEVVGGFIEDAAGRSFRHPEKYIPLFQELRECENFAFRKMLDARN